MHQASILIGADHSNLRPMLRSVLENDGYHVHHASDAQEALRAVKLHGPHLLVLDLQSPALDAMAILTGMQSITAAGARPQVLVLAASRSIPQAVQAARLGAADVLTNPFTPRQIRQAVQNLLANRADAPSATSDANANLLSQARAAVRLGETQRAEALLAALKQQRRRRTAEFFNLLGILRELQLQWRQSKRCYGKAIVADRAYAPSQSNMRRLYELNTFGSSVEPLNLGDEAIGSARKRDASPSRPGALLRILLDR